LGGGRGIHNDVVMMADGASRIDCRFLEWRRIRNVEDNSRSEIIGRHV